MYKTIRPLFIKTITPMHCGVGQDLGIVDLPIQREKHTGFPKIEASSLKGALRESFERKLILTGKDFSVSKDLTEKIKGNFSYINEKWTEKEKVKKDKQGNELCKYQKLISLTFGPENGDDHASSLGFTDARILFFPVKSVKGVFAWVTCPLVLNKAMEELKMAGWAFKDLEGISVAGNEALIFSKDLEIPGKIILEEFAFDAKEAQSNEKQIIDLITKGLDIEKNRIVIISNEEFKNFVEMSTEVITRTKIDSETGTVEDGALFTEEYLPSESIMYSLVLASPVFSKETEDGMKTADDVMNFFGNGLDTHIQIGGNATIGKGVCSLNLIPKVDNGGK